MLYGIYLFRSDHEHKSILGRFHRARDPLRDGAVSDDLEALVAHQLAGGIDGLVSVGTTGESPTLDTKEHLDVIRATVQASGKVPVYAGTGSNSTAEAVELTRKQKQPDRWLPRGCPLLQ